MSSEKRRYEQRVRAERQHQTRERIVEATAQLHLERGPARTTVADVARRAGVSRLTVYNHFPEDGQLFEACQAHSLAECPMPDFATALAHDDIRAALEAALAALYGNYRSRAPMLRNILSDRAAIPALDALMRRTFDVQLERLRSALSRRLGRPRRRQQAVLAIALDFHTWQILADRQLSDRAAAALMTELVFAAGARTPQ